ncbi:hypothetical protein BJ165DRAFT_1535241 [Panaeolus papilionaceus]|nr:hypothetical protein BJ165DRAFT_1535241 [Panaeolus papilionaceus]
MTDERPYLLQSCQLPVEILARIIRFYFYGSNGDEDKIKDLKAWSVLFAMRGVCRELVFRNITYGPFGNERRRWMQIGEGLKRYPHLRKYVKSVKLVMANCVDSIATVYLQFSLTLSDMLPNVQSVTLYCETHRPHHAQVDCVCEQHTVSIFQQMARWSNPLILDVSNVSVPIDLLAQIPRITTLRSQDSTFYRWPVSPPQAFLTYLSSVTLADCGSGMFFVEALNPCKLLKEITISGAGDYPRRPFPPLSASSSSFSQLEFISVGNFDYLAALSRGGRRHLPISLFPRLKKLRVLFTEWALRLEEISEVFCGISSLKYLEFLMHEIEDHTVDVPAMILPSIQHLRRIDLHIAQERNYKEAYIGQLNDALVSMREGNVLRELAITYSVNYRQGVPEPSAPRFQQLAKLVATLSCNTSIGFPILRMLFFLFDFSNYCDEFTPLDHWIRSEFLSLHLSLFHQDPIPAFVKLSFDQINQYVFVRT